jgi:ABC-type ATPase with predicted acetyltransferase domain
LHVAGFLSTPHLIPGLLKTQGSGPAITTYMKIGRGIPKAHRNLLARIRRSSKNVMMNAYHGTSLSYPAKIACLTGT